MRKVVLGLTMAGAALFSSGAKAQDSMNLYCSVQVEWCQAVANAFTRKTNIRVNMTQKGSGETLAQIRAEASNPRGDVWFGGTGDPTQQDCVDEATNTTSYLLVLQSNGLLKYHTVVVPMTKGDLLKATLQGDPVKY